MDRFDELDRCINHECNKIFHRCPHCGTLQYCAESAQHLLEEALRQIDENSYRNTGTPDPKNTSLDPTVEDAILVVKNLQGDDARKPVPVGISLDRKLAELVKTLEDNYGEYNQCYSDLIDNLQNDDAEDEDDNRNINLQFAEDSLEKLKLSIEETAKRLKDCHGMFSTPCDDE